MLWRVIITLYLIDNHLIYILFFTPTAPTVKVMESGEDNDFPESTNMSYWEELPCGIYSIQLKSLEKSGMCMKEACVSEVRRHDWINSSLDELIQWKRKSIVPTVDDLTSHQNSVGDYCLSQSFRNSTEADKNAAYKVLIALRESVMLRTNLNRLFQVSDHQGTDLKLLYDSFFPNSSRLLENSSILSGPCCVSCYILY
jgi:hypothetical protein